MLMWWMFWLLIMCFVVVSILFFLKYSWVMFDVISKWWFGDISMLCFGRLLFSELVLIRIGFRCGL